MYVFGNQRNIYNPACYRIFESGVMDLHLKGKSVDWIEKHMTWESVDESIKIAIAKRIYSMVEPFEKKHI